MDRQKQYNFPIQSETSFFKHIRWTEIELKLAAIKYLDAYPELKKVFEYRERWSTDPKIIVDKG